MVPRVLHLSGYLGSHVTFPHWAYHGHPNLGPREFHRSVPFSSIRFMLFEQNQRMVYREILIAGDLSKDDVERATNQFKAFEVSLRIIGFESHPF